MRFFLGTHQVDWLAHAGVDLFVSRRRLFTRKGLPRAAAAWALDSGGFTELSMHGRWTVAPAQYVREVRRFRDEIGRLEWAAPQDWMCEPVITEKTGLTVEEHQRRTVDNFLELRALAPDLPFVPVVQGWSAWDYLRCVELYDRAGVDLRALPLVGVGTVCRRQGTLAGSNIFAQLAHEGLRMHGFGVKLTGLEAFGDKLASSDSLAWSYSGRRDPPLPGHTHKNCANCLEYALVWRSKIVAGDAPVPPSANHGAQLGLFDAPPANDALLALARGER